MKHITFAVLKGFFAIRSTSIDHLIPANFTDHLQDVSTIVRLFQSLTSFNYPMSSLVLKRANKRPSLLRQGERVGLLMEGVMVTGPLFGGTIQNSNKQYRELMDQDQLREIDTCLFTYLFIHCYFSQLGSGAILTSGLLTEGITRLMDWVNT